MWTWGNITDIGGRCTNLFRNYLPAWRKFGYIRVSSRSACDVCQPHISAIWAWFQKRKKSSVAHQIYRTHNMHCVLSIIYYDFSARTWIHLFFSMADKIFTWAVLELWDLLSISVCNVCHGIHIATVITSTDGAIKCTPIIWYKL